jgi:hypothetical protein
VPANGGVAHFQLLATGLPQTSVMAMPSIDRSRRILFFVEIRQTEDAADCSVCATHMRP